VRKIGWEGGRLIIIPIVWDELLDKGDYDILSVVMKVVVVDLEREDLNSPVLSSLITNVGSSGLLRDPCQVENHS